MQPLLGGLAVLRVHQLVLGDEQAREDGERDKTTESRRRGGDRQSEGVAAQHTERVQRMPDSLPAWQTAPAMEIQLVKHHG